MINIARYEELEGDPVGDVRITGVQGDDLFIENTLIDTWLSALLDVVERLSEGEETFDVDLIDEPTPLHVEMKSGSVSLGYGDATLRLGSLADVRQSLIDDVSRLLPAVSLHSESPSMIESIRSKLAIVTAGLSERRDA